MQKSCQGVNGCDRTNCWTQLKPEQDGDSRLSAKMGCPGYTGGKDWVYKKHPDSADHWYWGSLWSRAGQDQQAQEVTMSAMPCGAKTTQVNESKRPSLVIDVTELSPRGEQALEEGL